MPAQRVVRDGQGVCAVERRRAFLASNGVNSGRVERVVITKLGVASTLVASSQPSKNNSLLVSGVAWLPEQVLVPGKLKSAG